MAWRAVAELRPSYEATRELLLPFSLRRWLVLAVIVAFASGVGSSGPNASAPAGEAPTADPAVETEPIAVTDVDTAWLLLTAGAVLAVVLLLFLLGSIMALIFVRVLTDGEIRIRGYFGETWRKGLSLFLFRLVLVLGFGLVLGLVVLAVVSGPSAAVLPALLVLVPVVLLAGVVLWLVFRLTTDFVVPVMLAEDAGVLAGWRAFWPALRADWKQYGVYVLARLVLGFVAGVVVAVGFVAVGFVLLVLFGILAALGYAVVGILLGATGPAIVLVVALVVLYALSVVVAGLTFVQVPVQTYLRYYSLFVLGSVTPAFDLVAAHRDSAAADEEPT